MKGAELLLFPTAMGSHLVSIVTSSLVMLFLKLNTQTFAVPYIYRLRTFSLTDPTKRSVEHSITT